MASKAKRHTHKYYRAPMGSATVWACALGDCNHFMPAHMSLMVNGKDSICWQCGNKMTLHPGNLGMVQPICDTCMGGETEDLPLSDKMAAFIAGKLENKA